MINSMEDLYKSYSIAQMNKSIILKFKNGFETILQQIIYGKSLQQSHGLGVQVTRTFIHLAENNFFFGINTWLSQVYIWVKVSSTIKSRDQDDLLNNLLSHTKNKWEIKN